MQLELILSALPEHVFISIDDKHPPKYDVRKSRKYMEKLKEVSQIKMCWQAFYLLVDSTAEEELLVDYLEWLVEGTKNNGCLYDD